jgi:hypothetical protein
VYPSKANLLLEKAQLQKEFNHSKREIARFRVSYYEFIKD